jgi:ethanolamine utilization microcompartment shell protein EutS
MISNRSSFFRRLGVEDEVAIAVLTLTPRPAHVKALMPSKQVLAKREG